MPSTPLSCIERTGDETPPEVAVAPVTWIRGPGFASVVTGGIGLGMNRAAPLLWAQWGQIDDERRPLPTPALSARTVPPCASTG